MPFWVWMILLIGLLLLFGFIYDKRSKHKRNIGHYRMNEDIKNKAQLYMGNNDFHHFF